jgi:hypothetical protein
MPLPIPILSRQHSINCMMQMLDVIYRTSTSVSIKELDSLRRETFCWSRARKAYEN